MAFLPLKIALGPKNAAFSLFFSLYPSQSEIAAALSITFSITFSARYHHSPAQPAKFVTLSIKINSLASFTVNS